MTSSKERPSAEREGSRLLHREATDGLLRPSFEKGTKQPIGVLDNSRLCFPYFTNPAPAAPMERTVSFKKASSKIGGMSSPSGVAM